MIDSIALYPVVARGIVSIEEFRRISAQAKEELAQEDAEPFVRLQVLSIFTLLRANRDRYACWGRKEAASDSA